jgi:hypothetical protein
MNTLKLPNRQRPATVVSTTVEDGRTAAVAEDVVLEEASSAVPVLGETCHAVAAASLPVVVDVASAASLPVAVVEAFVASLPFAVLAVLLFEGCLAGWIAFAGFLVHLVSDSYLKTARDHLSTLETAPAVLCIVQVELDLALGST